MCQRCADLEERVAWLESELGLQSRADRLGRLRDALHKAKGSTRCGSGGATRLLLALYAAKGKPVSRFGLMEASPPANGEEDERDTKILDVWVCHARKLVGRDGIRNVYGFGFRLTETGMARVASILSPSLIESVDGRETPVFNHPEALAN